MSSAQTTATKTVIETIKDDSDMLCAVRNMRLREFHGYVATMHEAGVFGAIDAAQVDAIVAYAHTR